MSRSGCRCRRREQAVEIVDDERIPPPPSGAARRLGPFGLVVLAGIIGLVGLMTLRPGGPDVAEPPTGTTTSVPDGLFDPTEVGPVPDGYRFSFRRDGIRPIYDPVFVSADEAGWDDDVLVLGVVIDGDARAYPINVLNFREIVNDTVGGVPIAASWCPLCATAIVHERVVDGEVIVLGNQGDLYLNGMTMFDHGTGSVWSQPQGRAFLGPLEGTVLPVIPSTLTTWGTWSADHPATLALAAEGGRSGFALDRMTIVVDVDGATRAYPIPAVRERGVINDVVGGVPVAVILDGEDRWLVVERRFGDEVFELRLTDGRVEAGVYAWSLASRQPIGEGPPLVPVPAFTSFAREYQLHHPSGSVWTP